MKEKFTKMNTMKKIFKQISPMLVTLIFISGASALISSTKKTVIQTTPWVAPASADALKNPTKDNEASIEKGKTLYNQMCSVCHGKKCKGDGPGGLALKPKPANLTLPTTRTQSDGALYWKITEGKGSMASYKKQLSEEQRWSLVNYIKDMEKQSCKKP